MTRIIAKEKVAYGQAMTLATTALLRNPAWGWRFGHAVAKTFLRLCRLPLVVHGLEHIPASGSFVIAANHASYLDGLINRAMEKQGEGQEKVVKRLAKALEKAMETHPYWVSQVPTTGTAEGYEPHSGRRSPGYAVWFRPDPSEKIRFKEIAAALLRFTGRGPQEDGN